MELSGTWRAAIADDDLRRTWQDDDFDDDQWEPIEVPGHWRSTPAFADSDGPVLHRRAFEAPARRQGGARGSRSTASSTKATSGSTAPTSATPRATSPRTPSRSPTRCGARSEHHLAVEVTCSRSPAT